MASGNYQALDYESIFGPNPFSEKKNEIDRLIGELKEKISRNSPGEFQGMDDPNVQNYMNSSLGSQRKLLGEYVKAAAGAGIKRGGYGVMGAPRLDSSLTYSALQSLARDYSKRLDEAMSYGIEMNDSERTRFQADMLNLQKLLNLQKDYLSEESDWKEKLARTIREDWEKQVQWAREDEAAKGASQEQQAKYRAEQIRAETELRKLQQEINGKLQDEAAWNRLMSKASLINSVGQFGAGWTTADDYMLKKLVK